MILQLQKMSPTVSGEIQIGGSKSETNRLLILQALFPGISLKNASNSDDSKVMQEALQTNQKTIDVQHAGTAMRFLTAYFATLEDSEKILTGSERMLQRPIRILVDALRSLGAEINYLENEGFPPLEIKGKKLQQHRVNLKANVSSQYISALMLVAPSLPNGLEIELKGKISSWPYIKMTLSLLQKAGFSAEIQETNIRILPKDKISPQEFVVESDWSSASYFYSIAALSNSATLSISSFQQKSYQGDVEVAKIYKALGVETEFLQDKIMLRKVPVKKPRNLVLDLANSPDLAQTIAVTCFGMGIKCELSGLHTLKIKETDRLVALKTEIEKLGGKVEVSEESIRIFAAENYRENRLIQTYDDHRMAMAFAPLALKFSLQIENPEVVSKSYPGFWEDLQRLGFELKK